MFGTALKFITLTFMYISTEQPVQKKHFTCINYQVRKVFFFSQANEGWFSLRFWIKLSRYTNILQWNKTIFMENDI